MILLDTNVVSELLRPTPDPRVASWMADQPREQLFLSVLTEAELRSGVAILPKGRRREALGAAILRILSEEFSGKILVFDSAAADAYATIVAHRRQIGKPFSQFDLMIAATAKSLNAAIATRNAKDFEGCEIAIINPWND